jgi:hypothetical protein
VKSLSSPPAARAASLRARALPLSLALLLAATGSAPLGAETVPAATPEPAVPAATSEPAAPAAVTAPASAPAAPTALYHSDKLSLDIIYPTSLASVVPSNAKPCDTVDFLAMADGRGLPLLQLIVEDMNCSHNAVPEAQLGDVSTVELKVSMKVLGDPSVSAPSLYDLSGHKAAVATASVFSQKASATFYGVATCSLAGGHYVFCMQYISKDCSQLPALTSYPIKFDGGDPVPAVPAALAPACR